MKRTLLVLCLSLALLTAFAVTRNVKRIVIPGTAEVPGMRIVKSEVQTEIEDANAEIAEEMAELEKEFGITIGESDDDGAFMGIFTEDLTLEKAAELKYSNFYGILITGVSANSPAQQQKLMADDILMQIGETKLNNKDHLLKLLQSYAPGDSAQISLFRNGETRTQMFVFGSRQRSERNIIINKSGKVKKTRSVGHGGGTWMPIFFMIDTDDVNEFITRNSNYSKISSDGIFLQGGGGKGNVGKGYFIGGMGAGYQLDKNYRDSVNADMMHSMRYKVSFAGVTLDKRFHLAKHLTGSLGFMLGGGSQQVHKTSSLVVPPTGGYDWNDDDYLNTSTQQIKMERKYIVFQPKTEVLYHLLSWLAIRGEAGYMLGYTGKDGWSVKNDNDSQVAGSPSSSFDGWTFSIGPWFGF